MAWGKSKPMPEYTPSKVQQDAYLYCVRNGIRVAPLGINGDSQHWYIEVSTDNRTWQKSPSKYKREDIWDKYYQVCIHYYNKR